MDNLTLYGCPVQTSLDASRKHVAITWCRGGTDTNQGSSGCIQELPAIQPQQCVTVREDCKVALHADNLITIGNNPIICCYTPWWICHITQLALNWTQLCLMSWHLFTHTDVHTHVEIQEWKDTHSACVIVLDQVVNCPMLMPITCT